MESRHQAGWPENLGEEIPDVWAASTWAVQEPLIFIDFADSGALRWAQASVNARARENAVALY